MPPSSQFSRAGAVVSERAGDRFVLLDAAGTELITLNPVGSLVWDELSEPRSVAALVGSLSVHFSNVPEARLRADVERFLAELEEAELVVRHAAD